jgi:protein-S-isoprenylcysteine O-methyltransferase Ste14
MLNILLGSSGFLLLFIADIFSLKHKSIMSAVFSVIGTAIIFTISIIILFGGTTYIVPLGIRVIAGLFTLLFLALLIYSVVIEVNLTKEDKRLLTTGTYALTRHPGVMWFLFYYLLGSLLFGNFDILIAGLVFTTFNVIYVIFQEKFIFTKLFHGYEQYQKLTPMLIPNYKSIKRCVNTIIGGQNEKIT